MRDSDVSYRSIWLDGILGGKTSPLQRVMLTISLSPREETFA